FFLKFRTFVASLKAPRASHPVVSNDRIYRQHFARRPTPAATEQTRAAGLALRRPPSIGNGGPRRPVSARGAQGAYPAAAVFVLSILPSGFYLALRATPWST